MEILHSPALTAYPAALSFMEARVADIIAGKADEALWFLEHPPLYTAGTSAKTDDLLMPDRFPVYRAGRGGGYTYHGPGQRVVYLMLDLRERGRDVRAFVRAIEKWIIATLAEFDIEAYTRTGRVGIWVMQHGAKGKEAKIAAIGLRLRRWVSFHGISINLNPKLEHFEGIVPCGISDQGITCLAELMPNIKMEDLDTVLLQQFEKLFKLHHNIIHREFVVNAA